MKLEEINIVNFLESLVMCRYSEKHLNEELSKFFNQKIELYNTSQEHVNNGDDDGCPDWNLMFNFICEDEYELFADIYVLPTRELDNDGDVKFYITEVGYEFN